MKLKYILIYSVIIGISFISTSCSDWLSPKPLSFYTPENAYTNYKGLKTGTEMLNRDIRYLEYYPTAFSGVPAFLTELVFSDVVVNGLTDTNNPPQDLIKQITPSSNMTTLANGARCGFYWDALFKGIKDANTIISRSANATYDNEQQKNEILAIAYFHRAWRYYRLVHQFGDVPLILEEVTSPRFDFHSTKREVILSQMKSDLEATVEDIPEVTNMGTVNRATIYHMLTKINLALGEFDDAIKSASKIIDDGRHKLMTQRFGIDKADATKNVIWDLHRVENKGLVENTEAIFIVIDRFGTEAATPTGLEIKRNLLPWYSATNQIKTPDGKPAFADNNEVTNPYLLKYGRGLGTGRGTWYTTNTIWSLDDTDLRHDRASGNWVDMEDFTYNAPALAGTKWYGKNLVKGVTQVLDTIRDWYSFPNYKTNVPDGKSQNWRGGNGDWYIFRLAETYLLRAEAYYWSGKKDLAMADINTVRQRAGARQITSAEVDMRIILDERARELFYEEPRKTELTRISYLYAKTGQTAYNGQTYSLSTFSEKNFFYDHIMATTDFYNKGVSTAKGNTYTMAPYHVLWPISESAIKANVNGRINQNKGYDGADKNIEPSDNPN